MTAREQVIEAMAKDVIECVGTDDILGAALAAAPNQLEAPK
jgi:hypothetical protein